MKRSKALVVGLGNVGDKYTHTRHNVGFHVIDQLSSLLGCALSFRSSFHAYVGQHSTTDGSIILVKPTCFMNNSGMSVSALAAWYKIPPESCYIVTDNTDIAVGEVRIKSPSSSKKSTPTHNGIRSVIAYLHTNKFVRVYLGIGSAREKQSLAAYVLGRWQPSEEDLYKTMFEKTAKLLSQVLVKDFDDLAVLLASMQN